MQSEIRHVSKRLLFSIDNGQTRVLQTGITASEEILSKLIMCMIMLARVQDQPSCTHSYYLKHESRSTHTIIYPTLPIVRLFSLPY